MPAKVDPLRVADKFLDKRTKMLPCQKEQAVRMHEHGVSIRAIAKWFNVDKRTIQFILFPERLAKNLADRQERGGTMQYYDRDKHRTYMATHRKHKNNLFA